MVADLEKLGLLVKTEPYVLSVGKCQRCRTVVEPLISTQWFVKMKPLAERALARARESGRGMWNADPFQEQIQGAVRSADPEF